MRIRAQRQACLAAATALIAVGCSDGPTVASDDGGRTETITITGDGHEVNLYRAATDGEALWLTDEMIPVLYRYDLETGAVTETRLNDFEAWTPTGEPSDIGVAVGGGVVWVADPCKRCPAGDIYKVAEGTAERWNSLPEPFWMTWSQDKLWVSSFARNEVVALDAATGKVTNRVQVDGPSGIAEAFGHIWMVGSHGNHVVVDDPVTGSHQTVSLGEPMALNPEHVVSAGGGIWVNNPAGALFRIDPVTLEIQRYDVPDPVEIEGGDDVIWIGSRQGVYRLHPNDGEHDHWDVPEISGLAVTEKGVFAVELGGDTVHRIDL